jgi:hypothetical protein
MRLFIALPVSMPDSVFTLLPFLDRPCLTPRASNFVPASISPLPTGMNVSLPEHSESGALAYARVGTRLTTPSTFLVRKLCCKPLVPSANLNMTTKYGAIQINSDNT